MNQVNKGIRALIVFLTGSSTLQLGLAQGCAMCKSSLAAQGQNVIAALQLGILVLLVPPLAIMGSFLYIAFRREDDASLPPSRP